MIHPQTELRRVDDVIGLGVFATAFIPKGTIVWALDALDQRLDGARAASLDPGYAPILDRYAFTNARGEHVLCWDLARFVNHSCAATCLSPGFDFEIAVRDIQAGEELTDDYGSLNLTEDFPCRCGSPACRGTVRPDDMSRLALTWDRRLRAAFRSLLSVPQPLWWLVAAKDEVEAAVREPRRIPSIRRHAFDAAAAPVAVAALTRPRRRRRPV